MKVAPLPTNESGYNYVVELNYDDITGAVTAGDLTKAIAIFPASGTFAAGTVVDKVAYYMPTKFDAAAAMTSLTVALGYNGATSSNVMLAATQICENHASEVIYAAAQTAITFTAADTVDAYFTATSTTGSLDTLTAGKILIYLRAYDINVLGTP